MDNSDQPNSHWYSGCGIYCHVWINKSKNIHISQWVSMSLLVPMEPSRYNHADEVELFVNGKSRGIRKKLVYKAANEGKKYKNSTEYHVMWRVTYQPGEVKVVARRMGRQVGCQIIKTPGAPDHIVLKKNYHGNASLDGVPTTFVEVSVVDKNGNLCPNADNQIFFSVTAQEVLKGSEGEVGPRIIGTDNGCQTSLERFTDPHRFCLSYLVCFWSKTC